MEEIRGVRGCAVRHRLSFLDGEVDIDSTLQSNKGRILNHIVNVSDRYYGNIKWFIVLNVIMQKLIVLPEENEHVESSVNFHSYSATSINVRENLDELNNYFMLAIRKIGRAHV